MLPFFDGERMPNLPDATGTLGGITRANLTPDNLARASVEAVLANLSRGIDVVASMTEQLTRVLLIGGAAQNHGVQQVAADTVPLPVVVPEPDEYVALGAAKQAAWALTGSCPDWAPQAQSLDASSASDAARIQFEALLGQVHRSGRN